MIYGIQKYYKQSATYKIFSGIGRQLRDFLETLGEIVNNGIETVKHLPQVERKELMQQCYRFGITSLPITLSVVSMSIIIVASQVALEMVKQGGGNFVGAAIAILVVRELAAIMAGFALISMIGSSIASEIATMRVTEQIDAMEVLKVNPIQYLFVPRVLSGIIMTPIVVVIAGVVAIIAGAVTSDLCAGLSYRAYFDSVWRGIFVKDLFVSIGKALCFGGAIALISCSCGYCARGGAKGVGEATNKAVVWAFVGIVIIDMFFAIGFFF
jgi:phospholipid/cholesterol/gamma-HCH transport system permease protein